MTRRNFILAFFGLISSANVVSAAFTPPHLSENISEKTNHNNIVMRSGWILLDSDK